MVSSHDGVYYCSDRKQVLGAAERRKTGLPVVR